MDSGVHMVKLLGQEVALEELLPIQRLFKIISSSYCLLVPIKLKIYLYHTWVFMRIFHYFLLAFFNWYNSDQQEAQIKIQTFFQCFLFLQSSLSYLSIAIIFFIINLTIFSNFQCESQKTKPLHSWPFQKIYLITEKSIRIRQLRGVLFQIQLTQFRSAITAFLVEFKILSYKQLTLSVVQDQQIFKKISNILLILIMQWKELSFHCTYSCKLNIKYQYPITYLLIIINDFGIQRNYCFNALKIFSQKRINNNTDNFCVKIASNVIICFLC